MISQEMISLGSKRSTIREIFEYGKARAKEIGAENVYDFSLGNPSVPPPVSVNDSIRHTLDTKGDTVHGYTSAPGINETRMAISDYLNKSFDMDYDFSDFYITCGAAASLTITLHALCNPGDEVIVIAPFFPEYKVFVEGTGAKLVVIPAQIDDFQIDGKALRAAITEKTKAVIINSPNNPSGAVYSEDTIQKLSALLRDSSKRFGEPVYLITDEPYREITYTGFEVPYIPNYYDNTIVCTSFSKSLSLAGERIGYIAVPKSVENHGEVLAAVAGAGRVLGFVNAPALFQHVIKDVIGQHTDIAIYEENKRLLYDCLIENGFTCVEPGGAFYLFPRALEEDAAAFCKRAQELDLLFVPGDDFFCPGHVRISYCVSTDMIRRALPAIKRLAESYR